MGLRVRSFLPSFVNMLNHLIEPLQMFQPKSNSSSPKSSPSSPKSSPSSPKSLQWLIQEIAIITSALSPLFQDIYHTHRHQRPPSFIGIDSWSAKGSQTHHRVMGQLLVQTTGIPWQWVLIRPKGLCVTYLQDSTPFTPPANSLHINTKSLHVYLLAWLSYVYLPLCS